MSSSARRALRILESVGKAEGPLGVTEIGRRLDVTAALATAPPPKDPQEPNEDVSYVKPGGILHRATAPLTSAGHKSGSIAARLDRGDDPRDVYRLWVPRGKAVSVGLQPVDGEVAHRAHAASSSGSGRACTTDRPDTARVSTT